MGRKTGPARKAPLHRKDSNASGPDYCTGRTGVGHPRTTLKSNNNLGPKIYNRQGDNITNQRIARKRDKEPTWKVKESEDGYIPQQLINQQMDRSCKRSQRGKRLHLRSWLRKEKSLKWSRGVKVSVTRIGYVAPLQWIWKKPWDEGLAE